MNKIKVRANFGGFITETPIESASMVNKGDILLMLDPAPLLNLVDETKALFEIEKHQDEKMFSDLQQSKKKYIQGEYDVAEKYEKYLKRVLNKIRAIDEAGNLPDKVDLLQVEAEYVEAKKNLQKTKDAISDFELESDIDKRRSTLNLSTIENKLDLLNKQLQMARAIKCPVMGKVYITCSEGEFISPGVVVAVIFLEN